MSDKANRTGVHWGAILGSTTLVAVVFLAQAYVTAGNTQQVFHWKQQAIQSAVTWYLWAPIFPLILFLARKFSLDSSETRTRNVLIHLLAGATVAILHAQAQGIITGLLLNSEIEWIQKSKLLSLFFWRFFVYQGILTMCVAFDWYQKAREVELESSRIEAGIFQAQIESLKMQLDPEFLYRSLRRLSTLMHSDLEEADTMVARLGDYLRTTLEASGSSEVTLRHELDFLRCYLEVENITIQNRVALELDIDEAALDRLVPGLILVAPVEDAIRHGAGNQVRITARWNAPVMNLKIQHGSDSMERWENARLPQLVAGWQELYSQPVCVKTRITGQGRLTEIEVPELLAKEPAAQPVSSLDPKEPETPASNPVRKWLVITSIFTMLAAYFTIQNVILAHLRGTPMNWPNHLLNTTGWYIWALLTPFILKLSETYPLQRNGLFKRLALHFAAFVASWVTASLAMGFVRWAANLGDYSFIQALPDIFGRSPFGLDILCYSTIVAVEMAIRYARIYRYGTLRTVRLSSHLARARLQALKMQLHPHFLFNALNSLSELMQEDPETAEDMIENLETFLRLTLSQPQTQEIPFEEELEFLKCYLSIEEIRFQNRLHILINIDPQAMAIAVPNMVLQPIVENAIKHGVAPRKSSGEIEIRAKTHDGVLTVSVRDNGPGISASRRKSTSRPGLGLSNTRERLHQLYGSAHRFEMTSAPEGGLVVTLEIPAISAFAPVN